MCTDITFNDITLFAIIRNDNGVIMESDGEYYSEAKAILKCEEWVREGKCSYLKSDHHGES